MYLQVPFTINNFLYNIGTSDNDEYLDSRVQSFPRYGMNKPNHLTFVRLLQHWAATTSQTHSDLTLLLRLLKAYQPELCYRDLPSTGRQLLYIDG